MSILYSFKDCSEGMCTSCPGGVPFNSDNGCDLFDTCNQGSVAQCFNNGGEVCPGCLPGGDCRGGCSCPTGFGGIDCSLDLTGKESVNLRDVFCEKGQIVE